MKETSSARWASGAAAARVAKAVARRLLVNILDWIVCQRWMVEIRSI